MNYGLPYKGSKNKLAEKINALFPKKKHFFDLFCGGCAITHRALIENKFETYTINDINPMCTELFMDAIHGKFKNEKRWISREDFQNSSEPYVRFCWSFGNNLKNYLYGEVVEPWKKALHYARVLNDFTLLEEMGIKTDGTQKDIKEHYNEYKEKYIKWYLEKKLMSVKDYEELKKNLESKIAELERLESLERLERLQSLQSLESLERLQRFNKSYDEIEIKENSLIYCDIPYRNTDAYLNEFDYEKFYEWCRNQKELTFISSYEMPENDFICIAEYEHRSILSANANNKVIEKVFIPKHQKEMWKNSPTRELTLFDDLDDF